MAKLRRNHGKGAGFGVSLFRLILVLGLLIGGFVAILPAIRDTYSRIKVDVEAVNDDERMFLPTGPSDQVIHHAYYSLGYDNDWEQPRWVAYRLTPKQLKNRRVKRTDDFRPDPAIRDGSADREDYRRSGYTRGHLVPAGDMGFADQAMSETFYYSNISPQLRAHNGGVWRELEETTRDWVMKKGTCYIVSGPIVGDKPSRIGKNQVAVPEAFYRVILCENRQAIGFVIPHVLQEDPLEKFMTSVDQVEEVTNLDFFAELDRLATPEIESNFDVTAWPSSDRRYKQRLQHWNNR